MDRRDFLRLAAMTGVTVAAPFTFFKRARAQEAITYDGNFYVMVNAGGGWDPTSFCDPKGALSEDEVNPMNAYLASAIEEAGNLRYAPVGGNTAFFQKYYQRLMVINGVDTSTNGHDSGSRFVWSGKLSEGHPAFGALVAACKNRAAPMAFLSNGGYDMTGGLVAPTRSGNTNALARIAYPWRLNPADEARRYHTEDTESRIVTTQKQRLEAGLADEKRLPRDKAAMNTLFTARIGENEVRRLTDFLPAQLDNSNNPLRRQAQLALASYKAGLSIAVNLSIGGFDTHGNHDANHIPRLQQMFEGVDFLMDEAERLEIADKVVVVMGSDFGRTPRYNNTNGKDHWSITSYMMMGAGIPGNRVIGATDHEHKPLTVNASTLALDPAGIRITPEHIHRSLRAHSEISSHEYSVRFPLSTAGDLPLFG